MIEAIKEYTEKVKNQKIRCDLEACPRCDDRPGIFKLHDIRKRTWLVIVERLVEEILSFLTRWKCPLCGKTFTLYPSFGLPYKRYIIQEVVGMSRGYVEDDRMTYREGVKKHGMPIFRDCDKEGDDNPVPAPSTLHRWVGSFGRMKATIAAAFSLLGSRSRGIFRKVFLIPSGKYRSEARKVILEDCARLFFADREFASFFGNKIFPHLATRCSWR